MLLLLCFCNDLLLAIIQNPINLKFIKEILKKIIKRRQTGESDDSTRMATLKPKGAR